MIGTSVELDFGLSLINCRKTAPFLTMVSETSEVLNVELLRCDSRERQKDGRPSIGSTRTHQMGNRS